MGAMILSFFAACFNNKPPTNPLEGTQGCRTSLSGLPDFAVSADEQSVAAVYGAASLLSKPIDVAGAQMAFPMYSDAQEPLEGVKVALSNIGVAGEYLYGHELSSTAVDVGLPIILEVTNGNSKDLILVVGSLSGDCKTTDAFVGYNFALERWGSLPIGVEGRALIVADSKEALIRRMEGLGLKAVNEQIQSTKSEEADPKEKLTYETAMVLVEELKAKPVEGEGVLYINSRPWGFIFVDTIRYSPWYRGSIRAGTHHVQMVSNDGRYHETQIVVRPNETTRFCWDFDLNELCQR